MAAPIKSEEGRGLNRKKNLRVSEPGALVIEHAEPKNSGESETISCETEIMQNIHFNENRLSLSLCLSLTLSIRLSLPLSLSRFLSLRCVHLRGVEHGGRRHEEHLSVCELCWLVVRGGDPLEGRAP